MLSLFKNRTYFTILFFTILCVDIIVKLYVEQFPYRYFSKPMIMGSLIVYYGLNNTETSKWRKRYFYIALSSFLLGDILFITYEITVLYIISILLFIVGKLFYTFRFSNQRDFSLVTLFPLFIGCFIYMIGIMMLVIDNLKAFFLPTLIYLFASLIVILFAFLRKDEVIYKSYILVFIGVVIAIISDSITLIQSFYNPYFPYHKTLIMLFYGASQFLIVYGIVEEVKVKRKIITS